MSFEQSLEVMSDRLDIEYTVGLKDGRIKYGTMLKKNRTEDEQVFWHFVPTNHVRDYIKSKDLNLVELIPDNMVSFVDCYSS